MEKRAPILEIIELPAKLRQDYKRFTAALDGKDPGLARNLIGPVLEHYVAEGKEVPWELEVAYVRLFVQELGSEGRKS